jgi:Protein of unknown function (DUF2997)
VSEQIKVTIKDGAVTIETSGFVGPACKQATERLAKALGTTVKDTPKAEFYQQATVLEQEQK